MEKAELYERMFDALNNDYQGIIGDYNILSNAIRKYGVSKGLGNLIYFDEIGLMVHDKDDWFQVRKTKNFKELVKKSRTTLKSLGLQSIAPIDDDDE